MSTGDRPWEPQTESYLVRHGPARVRGDNRCNKKLCFVATDKDFLVELLTELSDRDDCWAVKHSVSSRDGMYLGRCFLTDARTVGDLWDEYKRHPKLMCSIQDDDFTASFRREWNRRPPSRS